MKRIAVIWITLTAILLCPAGCDPFNEDPDFPSSAFISEGAYLGDYWPTEAWRECAPGEVGMDREKLRELNEEAVLLKELHLELHSILIIRKGYIVAEQYYSDEVGPDSLHSIYSCTKSITSSLFGIAGGLGYTIDLNSKMVDYFPDFTIANLTEEKKQITLENMLTMSDGLDWYELELPYGGEWNTFVQWMSGGGGLQFVLDRPMASQPGQEYSYSTGVSHLLSAILQRITGIRTDSFALNVLFEPIGIGQYYWSVDREGTAYGGTSVRLTTRDMARFGYLFLKNGEWDGRQIVPREWVDSSRQMRIKRNDTEDYYYGYQWWVRPDGSYSAVGYHGQWISIYPDDDLVVVFTNYFLEGDPFQWETPERLVRTYILPAIR